MSRSSVLPDLRSGDLRGRQNNRRRRRSLRRCTTLDLDLGGDLDLNLLIQVDLRRANDLGGDGALDPTLDATIDVNRDVLVRAGALQGDRLLEPLVHEDLVDLLDLDRLAVTLTARTGVSAANHDLDLATRLDIDEHEGLGTNTTRRLTDGTTGGQRGVIGAFLRLGVPLGLVVLAVELLGSGFRRDQLGVVVVQRRVVEDFGLGLARRHGADTRGQETLVGGGRDGVEREHRECDEQQGVDVLLQV